MENSILLKFVGDGLSPEKLDFKTLVGFIEKYFKIIISIAEEKHQVQGKSNYNYSLVRINPGSVELTFTDKSGGNLQESSYVFADAIKNNTINEFHPQVLQNIYEFSSDLNSHGDSLAVALFNSAGVSVPMNPKDYISQPVKYMSLETIYGELTDVGGARDANVHINSRFGSITCQVTKDQAKTLGSRLYTTIGLLCTVYRSDRNEKPDRLVVVEILPYDESLWEENISDLHGIFSERFSSTDVENFFRELRS